MLCMTWVFYAASPAIPAEDNVTVDFTDLVEKFSAEYGGIKTISIAPHPGAIFAVAICDDQSRVSVSFGSGAHWRRLTVDVPYVRRTSLKLFDLDGDQKAELLVGSDRLEVYRIDDQKLTRVWVSDRLFGTSYPPKIDRGDFDGDGEMEIAVLNYKAREEDNVDSIVVFSKESNSPIKLRTVDKLTLTDSFGLSGTSGLAIGDYVGDRRDEIAVGNDNGFLWLLGISEGKLAILGESKVPQGGAIGPGLASGNMDKDEKLELLVGTNGGQIFVCEFNDEGNAVWLRRKDTGGRLAYGVSAADLDGDGLDEFILSRGRQGYAGMTEKDVVVQIFKFNDGILREKWRRLTVDSPRNILHDIDDDGDSEIITFSGYGTGDNVQVFHPELD